MRYIFIILFLVYFVHINKIFADHYTSISSLQEILSTELEFLNNFEEYIKQERLINRKIERFLKEIEDVTVDVKEQPKEFYENPFNAFNVLKRFTTDWKSMMDFLLNDRFEKILSHNISKLATEGYVNATHDDLVGASFGLIRLQSTYDLESEDISEGILLDYEYESQLSAHDCFELGRTLYGAKNYQYATEWLIRARILLVDEAEEAGVEEETGSFDFPYISDIDILEFLAPAMFNMGNWKMATIFNEELLSLEPDNEFGLQNKNLFEMKTLEERLLKLENDDSKISSTPQKSYVNDLYESVCRGSVHQTPSEQRNLRCRYTTKNVPFYLIGPFKMEELNHDPFVAIYYNTISDKEMNQIINETESKIQRSKVGDGMQTFFSEIRTSQNTWLYYQQHEFLKPIHQRLEDITGLSLLSGEPLQVANYGIGGHYGPHYDFSEDPDNTYFGKGNRLLTAIYYINEVELGGATAFPFLRLAVPPTRGSLLVWFNMHESLELDYRTRHAGCPVLKGSKWICNEWFHEIGQEFSRPCGLERNGEISISYKELT